MSRLRSALIVEVPEASEAVDAWREQTCYAKPSSGVPAHVTILFPFVPAAEIGDSLIRDLHALFGRQEPFRFELRESRRFPEVLYLAPEPPEPFAALTQAVVSAHTDYPPYEGAFTTVVPHLTVAEGEPHVLDKAEADVRSSLPIVGEAREVILLEELEPDSALWRPRARLPLGAA